MTDLKSAETPSPAHKSGHSPIVFERPPTALGIRRWKAWMTACKEMGWPKSDMGALSDIFWRFKDHNGDLKADVSRARGES